MGRALPLTVTVAAAIAGVSCGSEVVDQVSWWVQSPPSGDRFDITVPIGSSSCTSFDRIEVDESADEVEIRAYVQRLDRDDCTADMATEDVVGELDAPLGERVLLGCEGIHGASVPEGGCRVAAPG